MCKFGENPVQLFTEKQKICYNEANLSARRDMFAAKVKSYAKLNLSLNVTGVSGGYHMLDSVVASVNIYDTVCAKPRRDKLVNVYMHGKGSERIPPEKNNAGCSARKKPARSPAFRRNTA